MPEKKRQEKLKSAVSLEEEYAEISVANKRAVEPFIKVFNYSGENIATSQLGTLSGVFEISEPNEESAYIVNFLASVAKKEYFINPRRGAVESFESALHKINLALSLLVKNGNTAWLGKLEGALAVIEKNNIHFSVTGETKILLLRNSHFSEISQGLASEESSLHPLKTFVEVGSGRLLPADKIIISSPELFTLLSLEDLQKNALRMDNERFAQFLRTVLVNELVMAGAIVLDLYESKPVVMKEPNTKTKEMLQNVFSEQAFSRIFKKQEEVLKTESALKPNLPSEEYIDSKTGHIYVQGDAPGKPSFHPAWEKTKLWAEETGRRFNNFFRNQRKFFQKGKKQGLVFFGVIKEQNILIAGKTRRFLQRQLKNAPTFTRVREPVTITQEKPKEKFFAKFLHPLEKISAYTRNLLMLLHRFPLLWNNFTKEQRKIILAACVTLIILATGGLLFLRRQIQNNAASNIPEPLGELSVSATPSVAEKERDTHQLKEPATLAAGENQNVTSIILNDEIYLIATQDILNVRENKRYALPAQSGRVLLVAPMDDLSLIFIYTDTQKFLAWSAINHAFAENSVALPEKTQVADMDTYLTYLYVLDNINNQIYRFPRAEGGFGAPLAWLKDSFDFGESSQMAINENVFVNTENKIQMFFRGRFTKDLESPATPLAITSIFANPDTPNVYALDAEHKRVLVWNQDGALIAQYFSEKLAGARTISVNEKTGEFLITTSDALLAFKQE